MITSTSTYDVAMLNMAIAFHDASTAEQITENIKKGRNKNKMCLEKLLKNIRRKVELERVGRLVK